MVLAMLTMARENKILKEAKLYFKPSPVVGKNGIHIS